MSESPMCAPANSRFKLIAAFLVVGLISLVQPGCDCSSSSGSGSTPSAVVSISPVSNSVNVLVSAVVTVTFLNDMNQASVENNFSLSLSGAPITATVTYDVASKTATLVPVNDLVFGSQYQAAIDSTVMAADGSLPLPSGFQWSFTTSSDMLLVSKNSSSVIANDISQSADIDGTGRYLVFESEATNLVTLSTTINRSHIYRKDTLTGEVVLVSSDASGLVEADNNCRNPSISTDGRFVVFESNATNLDPAITVSPGGPSQIFLKDLSDGSIKLISRSALLVPDNSAGGATNPEVSDDGRFILFESADDDLSLINGNTFTQIYRKDMTDESVELISRSAGDIAGNGASANPDMSSDGKFIAFESIATNLNTSAGFKHIYFVDTGVTHVVETISLSTAGVEANADSSKPSVSDDGAFVAFHTVASNLATDTNSIDDVYVRNRGGVPSTSLVSINAANSGSGDGASTNARINSSANYIVFESLATDLIAVDTNGVKDVFVRNLLTLSTQRVNNPVDGSESTFPINSAFQHLPVISKDGRYVGFHSEEQYTIDDTDSLSDVFRALNTTSQ